MSRSDYREIKLHFIWLKPRSVKARERAWHTSICLNK
jgi:hypothetical protein